MVMVVVLGLVSDPHLLNPLRHVRRVFCPFFIQFHIHLQIHRIHHPSIHHGCRRSTTTISTIGYQRSSDLVFTLQSDALSRLENGPLGDPLRQPPHRVEIRSQNSAFMFFSHDYIITGTIINILLDIRIRIRIRGGAG